MKLSEKLAALEEEERKASATTAKVHRTRADGKGRRKASSASSWDASKRKVRELVLAEVAPKMGDLAEDGLMAEVRSARAAASTRPRRPRGRSSRGCTTRSSRSFACPT